MESPESTRQAGKRDPVVEFLKEAHAAGFLNNELATSLFYFHKDQVEQRTRAAATLAAASPALAPEPEPHPAFQPTPPRRPDPQPEPEPVARPVPSLAPLQPTPAPTPQPLEPQPLEPQRLEPQPSPTPSPVITPPRPRRSRAEVWARFAKMRSKKLWGTFTADFAANALTYIGVLLSIVVIYVFFAFGYFGETIDDQHKHFRPLAEIGVVAFFLGLAWVLRHRSGIPQTSTAIEMIGIILVPIMLSASFRDGCTPAYRPWCLPPDVDGPGRWAAYAGAGLISTGIYYLYARRRAIYSYLVAPMLWVSLGAFALYLEDGIKLLRSGNGWSLDSFTQDGISAPQLILVLAAIGLSIAAASRWRDSRLGKLLAVPTVRAGVLFTPFVLALSLVFSYNDALSRGVAAPNLTDLAWPNMIATGIAAAVFAAASGATFAWERLGGRLRRDTALVLQVAAYLSLAASWLLTAGFGVSPAWLGAGLVGYSFLIAIFDRYLTGSTVAAVWVVRTALAVAGSLSLLEPGPTLTAWGALSVLAILRATVPAAAEHINRVLPEAQDPDERRLILWTPLLVTIGAGATRMNWPESTTLVLLGAATLFAATRLLPARLAELRSFATVPAIAAGLGSLGVEVWRQAVGAGLEPYTFSGFLLALALLAALIEMPIPARIAASIGFAGAAAMVALREYFGPGIWETTWVDTAVLAALGLAVVAASLARPKGLAFYGTIGHSLVVAAAARSLWFEETAILGLAVLVTVQVAEAVNIELDRDGLFPRLGSRVPGILSIPTLIAAVALVPLTLLIGRQVPIVADERARFGPVLAVLSWMYFAGALQKAQRPRQIALPFAYAAALAGVAVSAPSITALIATTASAAVLTALLAVRLEQPYASLPSWLLAVAAVLLTAYRAGVPGADLYVVLHITAALLVVNPALLNWRKPAHFRLRTRNPVTGSARQDDQDGLTSPWLVPPVYVGMILLPASLAMAIAGGGWIAWIAGSMAVAYTMLGVSTRAGGVAIPVAAAISIAYAAVLYDNEWAHPFDQPLVWMPLAALFLAIAATMPGNRRWRPLLDPAPGLVVVALGIATLSAVYSYPAGVLDMALVACSALLAAVYLIRAEEPWLVVGGLTLIAAGLVAGDYWAPAATLAASLVTGYFADHKREQAVALGLQAATTVGLATTFALTGVWLDWSAADLAAVAGIGAAGVITLAVMLTLAASWPLRILTWTVPLHLLGHGLAVTSYLAGVDDLGGATPYGLATLLLLLEAAALGVIGTVRREEGAVAGSAALLACAYGTFGFRQQWSVDEAILITAGIGAALSLIAAAGFLVGGLPERLRLWHWPALGLGQAAGIAIVMVGVDSLGPSPAAGIAVGVLAFDAVLAGLVGTLRGDRWLVAGSAALAAAAYGLVPQWQLWTRLEFITATAVVAVALAIAATSLTELRRNNLWVAPLHGLTVAAVVAIALKAVAGQPGWEELWMLSGVTFGLACYVAANAAAANPQWRLRLASVALILVSVSLAITAEVVRDGAVFAVMLLAAGAGMFLSAIAGLLTGSRPADSERPWRVEVALLALGLVAIPPTLAAVVFDPIGVEMGTLLVLTGAALAAYGLLALDLAVVEGGMVVWLAALMILVNQRMELTLHAAIVIVSFTLLATVELERYRRHVADQPVPHGLHHLEWALMLAPLALAVADMFESLWFGLALFSEGALLTGWGALSEVRRRALLGVGAMVAAIVLSVIIPALHGIGGGLTGGTWLAIGAVAATLFIIAGSAIERSRSAIGRRLAHIAEILEHWE